MREQAARAMPSGQPLRPVIRLHPADNVVIARATLLPGAPIDDGVSATQRMSHEERAVRFRIGRVRALAAGSYGLTARSRRGLNGRSEAAG
jgi:hypothetical protein